MPPAAAAAMLQPRGAGCCGQVHIPHVQPADQAHRVPGHAALKMLPLLMMNMHYTAQHHIARAVGDSKQQHDGRAVIMCCCKAGQVPVCPGAPEPLPCFNCLVLSCAWSCSGDLLRAVLYRMPHISSLQALGPRFFLLCKHCWIETYKASR